MFTQYRHDLKSKARKLRKEMTPAEKKLWFQFLSKNSSHKFLRQKPIGSYVVDFYCAEKKLVIELDGDSHFKDQEMVDYDLKRTKYLLEKYQIKVVRFTNLEVMRNFDAVCGEIEKVLCEI
jgi:very-short-patch-repair endonuclease